MRVNGARIARLAVRQQSDVAAGQIVAIKLEPLAAAHIFAENEIIAFRPVVRAAGAIRKEGELCARAARHLHHVNLGNIGKARADQHLPFDRIPVEQRAERNSPYWFAFSAMASGMGGMFSDTRFSPGRTTAGCAGPLLSAGGGACAASE